MTTSAPTESVLPATTDETALAKMWQQAPTNAYLFGHALAWVLASIAYLAPLSLTMSLVWTAKDIVLERLTSSPSGTILSAAQS